MRETHLAMKHADVTPHAPALLDPPLRSSKVAIVGFATETMGLAPFEDPECEIWILNMLHAIVPRWDRLWELHDRACIDQESSEVEEVRKAERGGYTHLGALQAERTRPIYMVKAHTDIPMSCRFPVELLTAHFGERCEKLAATPYFTSTFAYMLATAVLGIMQRRTVPGMAEPHEEIYVCGVEMLNDTEYAQQRACAEFLCGVAIGAGIKLHIPGRSALLESDGMYGYAHAESLELITRLRAWAQDMKKLQLTRREEAANRRDQAKADWNTHDGAGQCFEKVIDQLLYLARGGKI